MACVTHRKMPGDPRDVPTAKIPDAWPLSLHDRLLGLRDRILANRNFQQFAGTFLLTRPIARRRAAALFDLCAGFVYSQILFACVRLNVFERVAAKPLSAAEMAVALSLPVERTMLLLDAAVSLKLLQRRSNDRYGLGSLGAALRGNPGVVAMIEHHAMFYGDLADPVSLLRGDDTPGALASYWAYASDARPDQLPRHATASYTELMSASQPMIAQQVLAAYPIRGHRCLLDVGGGDGAFVSAVAAKAPHLRCMVFDLPAVSDAARDRFQHEGLSSRAIAIGGSFLTDPLPEGADIISLVRVVHDHDDDVVMILLRAARRALETGGTLLIAEPLSQTRGAEAVGDAYFGFYMLAMGSGRPRTFARLSEMMRAAGFSGVRLHPSPVPMLASIMSARAI